jgi:hypothetical protein
MQIKIANIIPVLILIFMFSCSSARRARTITENTVDTRSENKILELSIKNNLIENGIFIKNGKAHIESDMFSGNFDFYAKKNSVGDFMVSALGPIGIEILRIYGIRDSAYVIDRINRIIYAGKTKNVLKKYGLPEDFWTLLVGDIPGEAALEQGDYKPEEIEVFYDDQNYYREVTIKRDVLKASKTVVKKVSQGEDITFIYDKFTNEGEFIYPQKVNIDSKRPLFHVEISVESFKCPVNEPIIFKLPDYKIKGI